MKLKDLHPYFNIHLFNCIIIGIMMAKFASNHFKGVEFATFILITLFIWLYEYRQYEIVRDSRIISNNQSRPTQKETQ